MFSGTLKEMLTSELNDHLDYKKHNLVEEKVFDVCQRPITTSITTTIHNIYNIDVSYETIHKITNKVIPIVQEFKNPP
jgi:hypothetical protein